jgi:BirA family biotin operon repressor/biotin-[acetyl-CoA-carboxylase] ligase
VPEHEPLTPDDLQEIVSQTFLREVQHFEETGSTNTEAIESLTTIPATEPPALFYAESQTAGRGRGGNIWWSQPGSLTFSLLVDMSELGLTPEQQPQLSLLTGLALLQTGQTVLPRADFAVKWPNDVYLDGRKLAGILTEVPPQSNHHAVIGVGLNVNNEFRNAPAELQQTGISLTDLSGQSHSRLGILKTFLQHLDELLLKLSQGEKVLEKWPDYCLLSGKTVTIQAGPNNIIGTCQGIDESGALLLNTNTGTQRILGGVVVSWE